MNASRRSEDVLHELLRSLQATVTIYHPSVTRTPTTPNSLIAGTAFFPGGSGLWRGHGRDGALPLLFPVHPIMFVGHNFDSQKAFARSLERRGEAYVPFWQRLLGILREARLAPEDCFFTNALMGLKPGSALGPMPSVPGYREQCKLFLAQQVKIVQPRAVVALGVNAKGYIAHLQVPTVALSHPSDWRFRPMITRQERLNEEAEKLRALLEGRA